MTRGWQLNGFQLALASSVLVAGAIASLGDCVRAQITPDGTLPNKSIVTSQGNTSVIEGGTQKGSNLFHSFEQFSVPTGGAAHFNNALDVQNIFSRMTGKSISNIDGLIRANGTANLFLLNPNGIIFGPNARLDIGGSFLGSTASSLNFADGSQFSATATQTTALLTVSVPLGLQFGGTAGSILNQSQAANSSGEAVGLAVQPGKTLSLVGGDVRLDDGILYAPGGRVELGGVVGAGTVGLNVDNNNLRLSYPAGVQRADVSLTNGALVDASGEGGGDIQMQGGAITLNDNSAIFANTLGSQNGGGIFIRAEQLNIEGASGVGANTFSSGAGGNVIIETGKLFVRDGAYVDTRTFDQGQGGNLTVTASESVELIGTRAAGQVPSGFFTQTVDAGAAGKLTIETGELIVRDGAQVLAGTRGTVQGGALEVITSESVELIGESVNGQNASGLFNQTTGAGAAGDLTIATGQLIVRVGASVSTTTSSAGQGGNLTVTASESVELTGTRADGRRGSILTTSANIGSTGDAGNLTLETRRLIIRDGSRIQAGTFSTGRGGTLAVTATESVELSGTSVDSQLGSGLISSVQPGATGAGGNLTLETRRLIIRDGAAVSTGTLGKGSSGILAVNASETVELIGTSADGQNASRLSARTLDTGDAGDLTVETGQLTVRDGARIFVSSAGTGAAGDLTVSADSIGLDNQSSIGATTAAGNQGNITLRSQDLVLRRGSNITTNAQGTATGGNIIIDTGVLAALEDSDISANAQDAKGGQLIINAQGIFGTEFRQEPTSESDITASSRLGPQFSGTVEINTPDVDPSSGLVNLPNVPIDTEVVQACQPGGSQQQSEFVITGRGGLPPHPGEALRTDAVQVDLITLNPELGDSSSPAVSTNPTAPVPAPTVEAQGWVIDANGNVVLTARPPNVTPHSPWIPSATCHTPQASS